MYSSHIEPLWHLWISYGIDQPPNQDAIAKTNRSWASPRHIPNNTLSRGAFKTYSTYVLKPPFPPFFQSPPHNRPAKPTCLTMSPEPSRRSRLGSQLRPRGNEGSGVKGKDMYIKPRSQYNTLPTPPTEPLAIVSLS